MHYHDDDEPHPVRLALSYEGYQSQALHLNLKATRPRGTRTDDESVLRFPLQLSTAALRNPTGHRSSFVSDTVGEYVSRNLHPQPILIPGEYVPIPLPRTSSTDPALDPTSPQNDPNSLTARADRYAHLNESAPSPADPHSTNHDPHSSPYAPSSTPDTDPSRTIKWRYFDPSPLFFAPFYLYLLPNEFQPDEAGSPNLRVLPILSPNVPAQLLPDLLYLTTEDHSQTSDPRRPTSSSLVIDDQPSALDPDQHEFPLYLTKNRDHARVFYALGTAGGSPKRLRGWKLCDKRGSGEFRIRFLSDDEKAELAAKARLARSSTADEPTDPDDHLSPADPANPANPADYPFAEPLTARPTDQSTSTRSKENIVQRRSLRSPVVCASSADATDTGYDPTDPDILPSDALPADRTLAYFRDEFFHPRDYLLSGKTLKFTPPSTLAEDPEDPDTGLFAIAEFPASISRLFADTSLLPPERRPSARQIRRNRNHNRRPTPPEFTHVTVSPSGTVWVYPSLFHLTLILPRGLAPADAKVRTKVIPDHENLTLSITVNTEPNRVRNSKVRGATGLSSDHLSRYFDVDVTSPDSYSPTNDAGRVEPTPHYFLLEEPPAVTPAASPDRAGTLTLVFRRKRFVPESYGTRAALHQPQPDPIPDHAYTLSED